MMNDEELAGATAIENVVTNDTATRFDTNGARPWGLDRRTFMKATTLLALGGGALGGLSAPVAAQTVVEPWSQQQKLIPSLRNYVDYFGSSVSITRDGNTALVGASEDDTNNGSGAAYVFTRSDGTLRLLQKLAPNNGSSADKFGSSVSITADGNTALVGASEDTNENGYKAGSAYVFTRSGNTWSQQAKLLPVNGSGADKFGSSVSITADGNTALIGASGDTNENGVRAGSAYVFTRSGNTWSQQQVLTANDAAPTYSSDGFGSSVSITADGNTALIGAYEDDDNGYSGSAYVFISSGDSWSQQAKLLPSLQNYDAYFGTAVSIAEDGNTALVGASQDTNNNGFEAGSAYVFTRSGNTWSQQQALIASDGAKYDYFGTSVAIAEDGNTAFIGAPNTDVESRYSAGSVYVFTRSGGTWSQYQKLTASDKDYYVGFGSSVSLSGGGETVLLGAPSVNRYRAGSAYLFTRSGDTPMNQPPVASFTYSPTPGTVGEGITFDASPSSDDGSIVSYAWEFGDGTTGTGEQTTHTYTAEDDYEVTLTVTDDANATDTATQTVSVVGVFADPLVVKGAEYLPQDLDGDGLYEDINGDGVVSGQDSSALAHIITAYRKGNVTLTQAQIDALDFNGDGQLTNADIGAYNRNRKK